MASLGVRAGRASTLAVAARGRARARAGRGTAARGHEATRRARTAMVFTGIVQGKATLTALERRNGALPWTDGAPVDFITATVTFPEGALAAVEIGASIALNGVCLTVTSFDEGAATATFDIIEETLRRTNLATCQEGDAVNFERAARVGDEIGGHTVSGHVGATAEVVSKDTTANNTRMEFRVGSEWVKYILPKGFVAVDGCSLTVGEVTEDSFSVYLIPETLRATCFGARAVGDAVNVEVDPQTQAIVDTVERVLAQKDAQVA